jgi:hypothetical protein
MDNGDYKAICHEDKYFVKLKEKIDEKLTQINSQKEKKRQQLQQMNNYLRYGY